MHQKASIQQVQNMDVFLNCKQLRAIRCTLKQAQALALATGTFDLLQVSHFLLDVSVCC